MSLENDGSDSEDFDKELDSDDEIAILLNVHIPQPSQNDSLNAFPDNFQYRSTAHDQFAPTNPISYPGIKYTPIDIENEDKDEPRPWRDNPKTMPDYFNYGFTERTWEAYKFKQLMLRRLFSGRNQNGMNRNRMNHKYKNNNNNMNFNNNNNNVVTYNNNQ